VGEVGGGVVAVGCGGGDCGGDLTSSGMLSIIPTLCATIFSIVGTFCWCFNPLDCDVGASAGWQTNIKIDLTTKWDEKVV
jgi:hypothetical protein